MDWVKVAAVIVAVGGGLLSAYSQLSNHEWRISQIETTLREGRLERLAFQEEIREVMRLIREDVAVIKADLKRKEAPRGPQ